MSKIYEDFKKYRDVFGLNSIHSNDRPDCVTQNGALFTMEYLLCLFLNCAPELNDEVIRLREVYKLLEPKPGLSVRFPKSYEYDSMDNLGAFLTFSMFFDNSEFANRMRNHGKSIVCTGIDCVQEQNTNNKYYKLASIFSTLQLLSFFKPKNYWNTQFPTLFGFGGWFGRSPGFMGWLDIAATGHTTFFRALSLFIGQMMSVRAIKGNVDAWKLSYLIWWYLKYRGIVWRWGFNYWKKKLFEMYPGGMREVYSLSYKDINHPIREYSSGCF